MELNLAHARPEGLDHISVSVNGAPVEARLTRPRKKGAHWETTAAFETELLEADYTVLQFDLKPSQRPSDGQRGIGMAEMIIQPAVPKPAATGFWQAVSNMLRSRPAISK